jgi:predicted component of type VI protein secretion system
MQVRLVITNQASNESSNYALVVDEKIILGRHLESPVPLQGEGLSRHHFALMVVDDALTVEDLSSNGTWLNGALLKGQAPARIASGDMIEVPGHEIRVLVQDPATTPRPQVEAPAAMVPEEPEKSTAVTVAALKILEPREITLLLFATLSFALMWFILNR